MSRVGAWEGVKCGRGEVWGSMNGESEKRKKNVGRFDEAGLFGYSEFFSRLTFFLLFSC